MKPSDKYGLCAFIFCILAIETTLSQYVDVNSCEEEAEESDFESAQLQKFGSCSAIDNSTCHMVHEAWQEKCPCYCAKWFSGQVPKSYKPMKNRGGLGGGGGRPNGPFGNGSPQQESSVKSNGGSEPVFPNQANFVPRPRNPWPLKAWPFRHGPNDRMFNPGGGPGGGDPADDPTNQAWPFLHAAWPPRGSGGEEEEGPNPFEQPDYEGDEDDMDDEDEGFDEGEDEEPDPDDDVTPDDEDDEDAGSTPYKEVKDKGSQKDAAGGSGIPEFCFSDDVIVNTDKGPITMKQLFTEHPNAKVESRVGDEVEMSRVTRWLHGEPDTVAEFLEIRTAGGHMISLTGKHVIYRSSNCQTGSQLETTLAENVRKGDCLSVKGVSGEVGSLFQLSPVTAIRSVIKRGIYAPLTESTNIVVNGVSASCFASNSDTHLVSLINSIVEFFTFATSSSSADNQNVPLGTFMSTFVNLQKSFL